MEHLKNPESDIYKKAISRTMNINEKLEKSRMSDLTTCLKLGGPKQDILSHLKRDQLKI